MTWISCFSAPLFVLGSPTMKSFCLILTLLLAFASPSLAEETTDSTKSVTGLPLPRFASLKVDEANLRTGPGTRYPIDWVFRKEGLPVEITAEFDIWRRVRDWEGAEGWVHKSALGGTRTMIVTGPQPRELLQNDDPSASPVALIASGTVGHILSCQKAWCLLKFDKHKGYMPKTSFWGVYPDEIVD